MLMEWFATCTSVPHSNRCVPLVRMADVCGEPDIFVVRVYQ